MVKKKKFISGGICIVYEDKDIMVVDKPEGLLTVKTERENVRTAHALLTEYIRTGCGRSKKRLFVVHRLDRDTSGLLIFAKSEEAMNRLKDRWKENNKKYLAVVHGACEKDAGSISSYLAEDSGYNVYTTKDPAKGKLAQTEYRVLRRTKKCSLLEVTLLTGRKNQIRVHLASIGHPIVGDAKYGRPDEEQPRMALHAWCLTFKHPFTGKVLSFTSEVPDFFTTLVGRFELRSIPEAEFPKTSPPSLQPSPAGGEGALPSSPQRGRGPR